MHLVVGGVFVLLALAAFCAALLSCVALLSQAVRNGPNQTWTNNFNALVIGASYIIVFLASLLICAKRRLAVYLRLQRISKSRVGNNDDRPSVIYEFQTRDYVRCCTIAYQAQRRDIVNPGWGRPGTEYQDVCFNRSLLDTVGELDELVRKVIPNQPQSKPYDRMLHQFRFILPLLPVNAERITPLHEYESAIQIARVRIRPLSELEYELGMQAFDEMKKILGDCWLELLEGSSTRLDSSSVASTQQQQAE